MVISKLSVIINGYWLSTNYQLFSRVINGHQLVIIGYQWLLISNKLLMVINYLLLVINGYWLSTSYQCLSMVIKGYYGYLSVKNGYQRLFVIKKLSIFIKGYQQVLNGYQ